MPFFFETIMEAIEKGTVPPFERDSVMCLRKFEEVVNKTMAEKDQTIADLRAQLAELAQCRDHWKTSYEDVRAQLKQAEEERDRYMESALLWKRDVGIVQDELAAKEAELASLQKTAEGISHQCTILNGKLALYRKAVGPVVKAERFTKTDESWAAKMCKCCDAVRACIRILGEAGNERD